MSIDVRRGFEDNEVNWLENHTKIQDSYPKTTNYNEGGLKLSRIFGTMRRKFWIILIINAIVMGAAMAWNRTRTPSYEGSFKILIEPVTAESQVVSALKGNQSSVQEQDSVAAQASSNTFDYTTQIQLLLSEKLLKPVVADLKDVYPHISYETLKNSLGIIRFKDPAETKILEVRYRTASANETRQTINLVSHAYMQYSLNERQINMRRAVQFVDSQMPKVQFQVRTMELALQKFREKNQLIDPTIMGTQLGEQSNNIQREQLATQVELAKTKQLYQSLEKQLQLQPNGAEAASVLSEAPGYQQLVKQLQDLDVELQVQSASLTDENPRVILLREKRNKLLPMIQEKANDALGSSLSQSTANVQSLPYQNALRQDLSKQFITAATQVQILEAKLNGLNVASQTLARQTSQLPIISRQYENIQRQLKISTEELSKFSQKRDELMVNAARQEVPWEMIASPVVNEVSSSSLFNDLILSSIIGLLLGTGVALAVEKMSGIIYSLQDLSEEVTISILGLIPKGKDEQILLNSFHPLGKEDIVYSSHDGSFTSTKDSYKFSPFIESFRTLNSQVRLLSPDFPIRSLVVCSSSPNEGKTTIAIKLAQAVAAMGQRVLLVNADLRKPGLLSQEGIYGLTDVVEGKCQLMDAVQFLPDAGNLHILLAGSIGLDPTNILSSKKMQDLIEDCQHDFDFVIYDTAPLDFADSLILIPQTDGLLLVTSLGTIHREALRNSLRKLYVSNISVLGLVVNMVDDKLSKI
jgi:capsular exopolysaccharide synthesis family protein